MGSDIRISIPISAEPARLFDALQRRDDLRAWFSDDAEVSPAEKRYDFWGRRTPGAPGRDEGRHPLLAYDAPRSLAYAWALRGGESRVTLTVSPSDHGAKLDLHHALPRGRRRTEGALGDFWGAALERLKAWLERGALGFLPDFSTAPTADVTLTAEIAAPASRVFAALVEPALVEQWLALPGKASIESRVGGRYDIGWGDGGPVSIVEFEPGKRLAYSWSYRNEPATAVAWSLVEAGGATRLTLHHRGFADESLFAPYYTGWSFFLNRVKLLVETGQGRATTMTADDFEEAGV